MAILTVLNPAGYRKYRTYCMCCMCCMSTECMYAFCMDPGTNSDYLNVQQRRTVFTGRYELNTFTNSTFYPHSVSMCFVWV
jgi:hypothetical protein